jgi:hypothetical protein
MQAQDFLWDIYLSRGEIPATACGVSYGVCGMHSPVHKEKAFAVVGYL